MPRPGGAPATPAAEIAERSAEAASAPIPRRLRPRESMTVKELIEKLQEYPIDSNLSVRMIGNDKKIILVAENHELDPIFQFHLITHASP
jgi:hypothetical protein